MILNQNCWSYLKCIRSLVIFGTLYIKDSVKTSQGKRKANNWMHQIICRSDHDIFFSLNCKIDQLRLCSDLGDKCGSTLTSSKRISFSILHLRHLSFACLYSILQITQTIPLVDGAAWFTMTQAHQKLNATYDTDWWMSMQKSGNTATKKYGTCQDNCTWDSSQRYLQTLTTWTITIFTAAWMKFKLLCIFTVSLNSADKLNL